MFIVVSYMLNVILICDQVKFTVMLNIAGYFTSLHEAKKHIYQKKKKSLESSQKKTTHHIQRNRYLHYTGFLVKNHRGEQAV